MFCPKCGETNKSNAAGCVKCGYVMPVVTSGAVEPETPDGLKGILPTQTSGWAIAAGYMGLFSLLAFPGPFAIGCGIMALRQLKREPNLRGHVRAWIGIALGSLGSIELVFSIVAIVASLKK